jgi:hypothetical protein
MIPFAGVAAGAALMYFLDPDRGRRRRALVRDQWTHLMNAAGDMRQVTARDLAQRSAGLWSVATRPLHSRPATDDVIAERVRARLGRTVSHPHAVKVEVHDAHVTLSGPILASEVQRLMTTARLTRGVRHVENRLEVHEQAGNVSALQGGVPKTGERIDILQGRWSPSTRLLVGVAGAALAARASGIRHPFAWMIAMAGGACLVRAATREPMDEMPDDEPLEIAGGNGQSRAVPRPDLAYEPSMRPH